MNLVVLMGRLTNDPDVRYTPEGKAIARYTLAVDKRSREKEADFIKCICYDNVAQFAERNLHKGTKIGVTGKIRTSSYINKDGTKVYTTDVVVNEHHFCESKAHEGTSKASNDGDNGNTKAEVNEGFMAVSNAFEGLPF